MTSPAATDYPRSSNWQDFERLATALFSDIHQARFRRWGSAGQRKDGVDAWATLPDGKVVALRFEGRTEHFGKVVTRSNIDAALAELAGFPHPVDALIVLTTGPDDADSANYAAELSASRRAVGQSSVAVWGWPTIAAQLAQHPKVRAAFYGDDAKSSGKKLAIFAAAVLIVAGGAGSLFLGKNAIDASQEKPQGAAASVDGIVASLDAFDKTYRQCQAVLDRNTYTFSYGLMKSCRDPATELLADLSKKVGKHSAGADSQIKAELARMLVIFHEDVREAAAVTSTALAFDNAAVQFLKAGCTPGTAKAVQQGQAATLKKAGVDAVTAQVRYYFLLKDFIIPGLETAEEILKLHATGAPAPEQMNAAAGRMERLLTERTQYAMADTAWPFTVSSAKRTSTRDAVPGTPQQADQQATEEARWRDVLAQSATQSLRGRARDIDELISCGVLKKDARELAQPPGA